MKVKRDYYLLDVFRRRCQFHEVRKRLINLAREYKPTTILIERAGPGLHLLQELIRNEIAGVPQPIGITPKGDKAVRMEAAAAKIEAGQVHLPKEAPWLADFMSEMLAFPRSKYDDQVDSVSQFLNWVEVRNSARTALGCPWYPSMGEQKWLVGDSEVE
jgi:predicted phage terminase large subunit-like protein